MSGPATREFVDLLREQDPDFYNYLKNMPLDPNWRPDPAKTAEVLSVAKREECRYCHLDQAMERCSACKVAHYCTVECQRKDWPEHKKICKFEQCMVGALKETAYQGHLDE